MYDVKVYIYDLSRGLARSMSKTFLGKQIDGIWHTGIVAYGQEFFFGGTGGIECCPPGGTIMGQPDTIKELGQTQIPYEMFLDYLQDLSRSSFAPNTYHLLNHNCNTFSSEVAQFLTGNDIPSHITGLPADVLNTPFGQMIKPFVDAMSVQPSGGHSPFSSNQSQSKAPPPSGATGQSQGHTSGSGAASRQSTNTSGSEIMKFMEDLPDKGVWSKSEFGLSSLDQAQMKDVYEYLEQTDDQWSLGRNHLTTLCRLVQSSNTDCATCCLQIFSRLVLKEAFVQLISVEKSTCFSDILAAFENQTEKMRKSILKMLTNACSSAIGVTVMFGERHQQPIMSVCVSCLSADTSRNANEMNIALALCYNITQRKVNDDLALELGSALLHCVDRVQQEKPGFHMLSAILQLVQAHEEVRGLAQVLGLNLDSLRGKSERLASLCDRIQKLTK